MGYLLNGVDTGGVPMYLIKKLIDAAPIPVFCETGTASGDSAREASKYFDKVYTIELIEHRAITDDSPGNIVWRTGQSIDVLPQIIQQLNPADYCLFFLDAHYSDPGENTSDIPECPVLQEIKTIGSSFKKAVVFIDDARLFFGAPPYPLDPRQWPSIADIFEKLKEYFPDHFSTITDDYIIAIPQDFKEALTAEWRGRFHIRYPSASAKLLTETKNVYKAFLNLIK